MNPFPNALGRRAIEFSDHPGTSVWPINLPYADVTLLVAFMLGACSSTGVVPMDRGTSMIAKSSAQIGFGQPDGVKAEVYREANEFCAKEQKEVETINLEVTNSGFARPGNVSLQFRCK